jgi:TolB-like protein/DNA-binding winged helix-turn-helix (wHTH) protein
MNEAAAEGAPQSADLYYLGDLCIDPGRRLVSRTGVEVPLPKLSLDLLLVLLKAAPNVVTIDEFMRHVWRGVVVSPETVSQRVKLLRDALGDDPRHGKYVIGVRGLGYRVVAPVSRQAPGESTHSSIPNPTAVAALAEPTAAIAPVQEQVSASLPEAPRRRGYRLPRKMIYLALSVTLLIGVLGVVMFNRSPPRTTVVVASLPFRAVAVLPFANLSADHSDEYLALGLSEMVLNRLSGVPTLQVVARTSAFSFRGRDISVKQIGHALNVRYLVEGSVQRVGQQVRVTAQLIDVESGRQFTAMHIDRDLKDIFRVQDEIADRVAVSLAVRVGDASTPRPEQARGVDTAAYLEYLQGRAFMSHFNVANMDAAAAHFERAISIDSHFAAAYAGLARARFWSASGRREFSHAEQAQELQLIEKALALDDGLGDAYITLGYIKADDDPAGSETDFRKGLQLAPSDGLGFVFYAEALLGWRRVDEATQMLDHALLIDPLSPRAVYVRFLILDAQNDASRSREAEALLRKVLDLDPNFTNALVRLAEAKAMWHGQMAEAIRLVERALQSDPHALWIREDAVPMYLWAGDPQAAASVAEESHTDFWFGRLCLALYGGDWRTAAQLEFNRPQQLLNVDDDYPPVFAIQWFGHQSGEFDRAISFLRNRYHLTAGREFDGNSFDAAMSVAILTSEKGDVRRAKALAADALRVLDRDDGIATGSVNSSLINRGKAHIVAGEYDLGLEALRKVEHSEFVGGFPYGWILDRDPLWDPVRADPRFQSLVNSYKESSQHQRTLLEEMRRTGGVPLRGEQTKKQ